VTKLLGKVVRAIPQILERALGERDGRVQEPGRATRGIVVADADCAGAARDKASSMRLRRGPRGTGCYLEAIEDSSRAFLIWPVW